MRTFSNPLALRPMPVLLRLAALLALVGALPAAAQDAPRLSPTEPRVLFDATDTVKDDDGTRVTLRTTLVYDPAAGEYVQTVTEADGRLRSRDVRTVALVAPTPAEHAAAQALVAAHPEIAPLLAAAEHPVSIEGGFALVREAGHACGPGSRCVQYDVYETVPGEAFARRLRYVVVDLRAGTLVSADFDVAREGNLAHPAARAQSRAQ